jgi:hypothetical protein
MILASNQPSPVASLASSTGFIVREEIVSISLL